MHRRFAIASYLPLLDPTYAWAQRRHHVLPQMPLFETPGDGGGGGGDGKKKKAKLTDLLEDEEYQEQFDALLEKRLARERKKLGAGKSGDGMTAEEREELQRLRDEADQRKADEATRKGEFDKVLTQEKERWGTKEKGYTEKLSKLTEELRRDRVRSKLVSAAAAAGAIDPEDIADLLEKRVKFDSEKLEISVLKEDLESEALNGDGDPLSIEDLVGGFLTKKKHLARAADGEGGGAKGGKSKSNAGQEKKDSPDIAKLREQVEEAETAAATGNYGALTRAQQLRTKLEKLEKQQAA
jgi:hypothetical protein